MIRRHSGDQPRTDLKNAGSEAPDCRVRKGAKKPLDHPGEHGLAGDASIFSRRENARKRSQSGREVSGRHSLDARRGGTQGSRQRRSRVFEIRSNLILLIFATTLASALLASCKAQSTLVTTPQTNGTAADLDDRSGSTSLKESSENENPNGLSDRAESGNATGDLSAETGEPSGSQTFENLVAGESSIATGVPQGRKDCATIFFGGYGASQTDSTNWASGFIKQRSGKHCSLVVSVRGPRTVSYVPRDLRVSAVVARLVSERVQTVNVLSHSSGTYVANEFVDQFSKHSPLSNLNMYVLDGGYPSPRSQMYSTYRGVWAKRGGAESRNARSMRSIADNQSVTTTGGCQTAWCLHFGVITPSPQGNISMDYASAAIVTSFIK